MRLRNREPPPMGRTGTPTVESAISTVRTRLAIKPAVIHVQHVTRVRVRDLTVLCPGPLYLLLRIYLRHSSVHGKGLLRQGNAPASPSASHRNVETSRPNDKT